MELKNANITEKETKVILEENKTDFENQTKEYLNMGYKIIGTNITSFIKETTKPIKNGGYTISNKTYYNTSIAFYALMIKE